MKTEQQAIDAVLMLISRARRFAELEQHRNKFGFDEAAYATAKGEYERSLAEVEEMGTPEYLVMLVRHYEMRLAKMEAESARATILKEAIREVINEDRNRDAYT